MHMLLKRFIHQVIVITLLTLLPSVKAQGQTINYRQSNTPII